MAFHIVTNRCFLACEKVTSVVIEEIIPDKPTPRRKRKKSKNASKLVKPAAKALLELPKQFSITISYYPLTINGNSNFSSNSRGGDPTEYSLDLRIVGKQEAYALYAEIIREVQEQHPGEGYLDKLVNKMLEGIEFQIEVPQENPE